MAAKKKRKGSKVRKVAMDVILVCLIGIAGLSAFNIYKILNNYRIGSETYKEIANLAGVDIEEEFTGDIDWDALRAQNPDVIAWIYLKGTKINYPIVQASDNDYYLRRMFNGASGIGGTLFADYRAQADFKGFNSIIYGHHMRDSSMFGALKSYTSSEYASENPQFELITPDAKYHLQVVAFLHIPASSAAYEIVSGGTSSRENYVDTLRALASYTTGVSFGVNDHLVMLSTCAYEYDEARYAVVGKLVPWEGEKAPVKVTQKK